MVDIHSHILAGLDDGATSLDESIAMATMAAEAGTTDIVATPHANAHYSFDPLLVEQRAVELGAAVPQIRIRTGCDFHLNPANIADAIEHPRKYTINRNQYLLVEFPDIITFTNTDEIFARLRRAGMLPIITHPERNASLQQMTPQMSSWLRDGAYIQVTAQSLLGAFGSVARRYANELVERRMVHFVASDAHDLEFRTTRLRESFDYVAAHFGADTAMSLFVENPAAALSGAPIPVAALPRPRRWFEFWK